METKFITFNDIIVNVNEIVDVERPSTNNVKGNNVIVNLSSGRSIDTAFNSTEAADKFCAKIAELLKPVEIDVTAL